MTFILAGFRIAGILFSAPMYGSRMIPINIKVALALLLTVLIAPLIEPIQLENIDFVLLVLVIAKELLLGIAIGLLGYLLLVGVQIGGQIIGFQMGFGVVNVFDPMTNTQLSIIAQFKNIAMLLFFVALDGHHMVIGAISESFDVVPVGTFVFQSEGFLFVVQLMSLAFSTAIQIVAPIFVTLLTLHTVMGIMGRLVPQLNLMIVGFPLQIATGLTLLSLSLNYFYIVFEKLLHNYFKEIATLFSILGG